MYTQTIEIKTKITSGKIDIVREEMIANYWLFFWQY